MKNGKRKGKRQRRQRASGASAAPPASTTSTGTAGTAGSSTPAQGSPGGASIRPWWEREAGRLEYELNALDDAGITYQVDQTAKLKGLLIIDLELNLPNEGEIQ